MSRFRSPQPTTARCSCGKWSLHIHAYDRHGYTFRCYGCKRIPNECRC